MPGTHYTFVVTTATQSLQRCYLENVADMTYVAMNVCHFGANFQNFELKIHIALVQRLWGDTEGLKEGPTRSSLVLKTTKNDRSKQ